MLLEGLIMTYPIMKIRRKWRIPSIGVERHISSRCRHPIVGGALSAYHLL